MKTRRNEESTMKKRLMAMVVALSMIVMATGCGKNYKIGENGEVYNDYVKISQWKGLEIEKVEPAEVTDEDLQASIESDLYTLAEMVEVTDRGAQNGDQVTVGYVGKIDGVAFEGGTSTEDDVFILGQGSYIEGFQEGIVGHKAGEVFDVAVTFPEDYGKEELNGKDAVFTMTLTKVEEEVIPELTDEVAKQLNSNVSTVDEYKAAMKANLEENYAQDAKDQMRSSLLSALYEKCEVIEYPEERLEETKTAMQEYYRTQLESYAYYYYQMTLDELISTMGTTEEELIGATYTEIAESRLLCELALELVAEVEELDCSDEAYQAFLEEEAELWGCETTEEVEESYDSSYGSGSAKLYFMQIKVSDFLLENCKFVEATEDEATEDTTAGETTEGTEDDTTDEPVTE